MFSLWRKRTCFKGTLKLYGLCFYDSLCTLKTLYTRSRIFYLWLLLIYMENLFKLRWVMIYWERKKRELIHWRSSCFVQNSLQVALINLRSLLKAVERGIRGWVLISLITACPSLLWVPESRQGLWIISCEEAILLAYWTSVVQLRYQFVPEIMQDRAPEVLLHK
jgi:hypothetical protein